VFLLGERVSGFGSGFCTGLAIAFVGLSIAWNVRAAAGLRASRGGAADER
jgi:hypothetical protein